MNDPRWTTVDGLFEAALERDPAERAAFLREACGGNETLRQEVESLLAHASGASALLERPALELVGRRPTAEPSSFVGRQVGTHRILGLLGTGGMGEVYRANDTKLGRDVAIKILPRIFTTDPERRARFDREARSLAALNHPHIGAIYGVEDIDGTPALILELVEGETLAARIAQGAIPVRETLTIAGQFADALEAAHDKGIVHRDLKPANIKITPQGVVKVLDFGLAKAASGETSGPDLSQSPTFSIAGTRDGVILGTAAYMSPEQARGKPVDKRTDIWAFGCVLYEMLTGRAAFGGETISDTLAAILDREPDAEALPSATPQKVRDLLRRCLQKDPQRRLRDIADARFQMEEALSEPAAPLTGAAPAPEGKRRERLWWIAALLAVAAGVAASTRYLTRPTIGGDEVRLDVTTPPTSDPTSFAISPDGTTLVFVGTSDGKSRLWLRSLAAVSARPLAGTDDATRPFWSPDSRSVGFSASGRLKRIDVDAESVQLLGGGGGGVGSAWNEEGTVLIASGGNNPISRVSVGGGEPTAVTPVTPETNTQLAPRFLPDGRHFLFTAMGGTAPGVYLGLLGASDPPRRIIDAVAGTYASGHLLFVRQDTLFAQPFDPVRHRLDGSPTTVADQIVTSPGFGMFALSASATGPIAYRAGPSGVQSQFVWFDRSGTALEAIAGSDIASSLSSSLSPDGHHLAITRNLGGGPADVWLLDLGRGVPTRLTVDPAFDILPVWSPDGRRIAFASNRTGTVALHVKSADGTGNDELLASGEIGPPSDWSPDGRFILAARQFGPRMPDDVWAVPVAGDRKAFPVVESKTFHESNGQFSPDGRWIAFQSNETGRVEIYVQPFPGPGRKWLVSSDGGVQARWRRDGSELFYIAPDSRLMAVPIRLDSQSGTVDVGAPVSLFTLQLPMSLTTFYGRHYMVSQDGQRFLVHTVKEVTLPITVVLNWKPKP